jgi:hypothetical protein
VLLQAGDAVILRDRFRLQGLKALDLLQGEVGGCFELLRH